MSTGNWFILIGALLLMLGLTRQLIQKIPATSAMIYLIVGMIVGPIGLATFHFNPLKESGLLEILTEVAVLISLFAAGVKMPVPFGLKRWRSPLQLAFISMTITVALVALFAYYLLNLPLGAAILLGAIIAPTDPVLATDVQVRHPGDEDELRFALTSEAGMNDGSAFPFVMLGLGLLGLHDIGDIGLRWILVDVIWATAAAIAIGIICGWGLARIAHNLRSHKDNSELLDDFLGLGLIACVYGLSLIVNSWGFLAVFTAAVALRQTELKLKTNNIKENLNLQGMKLGENTEKGCVSTTNSCVSEASLIFKEHLERLSEIVLILLVGGMLFLDSWSWKAVAFTCFLFFIARPLSVFIGTIGTSISPKTRLLCSWFGVRGIGSIYYLMYAIEHGVPEPIALQLIHITLVVITLSIFIHGISVKPVLNYYQK